MPLPISKSQVRKLGDRLRDTDDPVDEDRALFAEVLGAYDEALGQTEDRLAGLGLSANTRLKNSGTITEKLRRDRRLKLDSVQDLAGARIVLPPSAGRPEQDRTRDLLVATFGADHVPRVTDRRLEPSHGYRAVHIVVRVSDLPVEIQVRTTMQHHWAQYFERLADQIGRGIRYGARPERLDALLADERLGSARQALDGSWTSLVELAGRISDLIATVETDPLGDVRRTVEPTIEQLLAGTEVAVRELLRRIDEVLAS